MSVSSRMLNASHKTDGSGDAIAGAALLATGATLLALRSDAKDTETGWVHRRVEKLEFLDARAIRWHVSIDFRVPDLAPQCPHGPPGYHLVPLTVFPKQDLAAFDLRDENDRTMWLPTGAEVSPLLVPAMIEMAKLRLKKDSLPDGLANKIAAIITEVPSRHVDEWLPFEAAEKMVDTEAEAERITVRGNKNKADIGILCRWCSRNSVRKAGRLAKEAKREWREVADGDKDLILSLVRNKYFRSQLDALESSYVAFVAVDSGTGSRRVVKFSWERSIKFEWEKEKIGLRRIAQSAGWRRWALLIPVAAYGGSGNCEVAAPPGVDITRIDARPELDDDPCNELGHHGYAPHVSIRIPPASKSQYQATAYVRINPWGWLTATLVVTAFITAAMWAGYLDLRTLYDTSPGGTATREADTAATVLAAVLALIAGWLVRPGEHPLASRLLLFVRLLLGLDALVALAGTGYLILRGGGQPDSPLWLGLAVAATVVFLLVLISWAIPVGGLRRKR